MLFVRGIKGYIKLNPAIKLFGSMVVASGLLVDYRAREVREAVRECQEKGGTWLGGVLPSGYCAVSPEQNDAW